MIVGRNILSPKVCNDLNLFTDKFESSWVSLKILFCSFLFLNVTYNHQKQNSNAFLDQLLNNIDNANTKTRKVKLPEDYFIKYLDKLKDQNGKNNTSL